MNSATCTSNRFTTTSLINVDLQDSRNLKMFEITRQEYGEIYLAEYLVRQITRKTSIETIKILEGRIGQASSGLVCTCARRTLSKIPHMTEPSCLSDLIAFVRFFCEPPQRSIEQ
jgi:hypothetical protein